MPTKAELLDEAYRRDLLPPDKKAAYEEAQKRGLVGQASAQPAAPFDPRASREASLDKRTELRQVENLKKKAERAGNTTTAEDAFVGQAAQWGTSGLWDGIRASYDKAGEEGGIMQATRDMVPIFGALPYASDKVRAAIPGEARTPLTVNDLINPEGRVRSRTDDLEAREDVYEKQRGVAMQEHPVAGAAGSILGALGPGTLQYKAASTGVRMIPGVNALADMVGGLGRTASYTGRLGTSAGGFYADSQVQGMMAGAGDEAALAAASGEPQTDMTLADRTKVGQQYANFGPEVGGVKIPVSAALPVVGSIAARGTNMVRKGYATPDAIAATQANVHGRAPTRGAVPQSITETTRVLDGQIVPGDVRGIMGIENALRDALKGVQVNGKSRTAAEIDARIADGFKSIREQLPLLDDTTLNFARLIEREFSDESPQVTDTIRRFLLKVGMDTPEGGAVVQSATNSIRGKQNDILEQEAKSQFGTQPKIEAKQTLKDNKRLIGQQGYDDALSGIPQDAPGQSEAIAKLAARSDVDGFLSDAANAEGISVQQYVERNPLKALHEVRSALSAEARDMRAGGAPDFNLEREIKAMGGVLDASVPNYKQLREMYRSEATAYDRLGTTRGAEAGPKGELGYEAGFGERLFGGTPATPGAASRAEGRATAKDVFAGMDPQSKKAAALSVRDVILDDLGKARAAGVEERYATAAKFNALRTQGALEALEDVFGAEGKAVADRVRQFVDANQFARDIDPNFNSATMNKGQAMKEGAVPFSNSIGRKLGTGVGGDGDALLGDATLLMTGNAPVLSMMRGARHVPKVFQPRKSTQIKVAKTLLKESERGGSVPPRRAPPGPINALRPEDLPGRVKTATNALAGNDSGMVTPDAASALSVVGGAGTGASMAGDVDGDGKVTWKDRAAGAAAGAAVGYGLKKGIGGASDALFTNQVMAREGGRASRMASEAIANIPKPSRPGQPMTGAEADDLLTARLNEVLAKNRIDPRDFYAGTAKIDQKKFAPMQEAERLVLEDMKALGYGPPADAEWLRAIRTFSPEQYNKWQATGARDMVSKFRQVQGKEMTPEIPPFEGPRVIDSPGRSMVKPRPSNDTKSSGVAALRGDASNALAGGAVGAAAPADNNRDRARNALIGATGAAVGARAFPGVRGASAGISGKPPKIKPDIPLGTRSRVRKPLPDVTADTVEPNRRLVKVMSEPASKVPPRKGDYNQKPLYTVRRQPADTPGDLNKGDRFPAAGLKKKQNPILEGQGDGDREWILLSDSASGAKKAFDRGQGMTKKNGNVQDVLYRGQAKTVNVPGTVLGNGKRMRDLVQSAFDDGAGVVRLVFRNGREVYVAKDASVLRSPRAGFDPSKSGNKDIMAGIPLIGAGAGATNALATQQLPDRDSKGQFVAPNP